MQLDAEDLLARIQREYPMEYEIAVLREQLEQALRTVEERDAEIAQLRAAPTAAGFMPPNQRTAYAEDGHA